ncbi:MAG: hypothetical protein ACRDIY_07730 [Chloroflexota bacterium]
MPVHIQEITSNVTVADEPFSAAGPTPPVADAIVATTEELPHLETLVSEVTQGLATAQTFFSPVAASNGQSGGGATAPLAIDPAALYERVLRLMLDDLVIARERE